MRKLKKYKPTKFAAKDSTYDKEAADFAVNFIECLCHTKGTWAGKPFELIDWQEQIIRDVFGTMKPNGYRQFNTHISRFRRNRVKVSLLRRLRFCSVAGMERKEPRFMDARLTGSRRPSFLRLPLIWSGCVRL